MTLPANLDPNKMYVTPSTTQPTYVHSAQGEQFAVWSPTPLRQTDMLEVTEDRVIAEQTRPEWAVDPGPGCAGAHRMGQWQQGKGCQCQCAWNGFERRDTTAANPTATQQRAQCTWQGHHGAYHTERQSGMT